MSGFQLPAGFRPAAPPSGGGPSVPGRNDPRGDGASGPSEQEAAAARERAQAQEEMKRTMIQAMLEPAARERCEPNDGVRAGWRLGLMFVIVSRISLTRPQLAGQVEELLVHMGQSGQIRGQVSDEALKGLLEQVRTDFIPVKTISFTDINS